MFRNNNDNRCRLLRTYYILFRRGRIARPLDASTTPLCNTGSPITVYSSTIRFSRRGKYVRVYAEPITFEGWRIIKERRDFPRAPSTFARETWKLSGRICRLIGRNRPWIIETHGIGFSPWRWGRVGECQVEGRRRPFTIGSERSETAWPSRCARPEPRGF